MFAAAHRTRRVERQAELFGHLRLRDESTLRVAIAAEEVAEAASPLGELPSVFGPALRARETGTFEDRNVAAWCVVADHLGERLSLRMLWVEAAGEVPAETPEALLHRVSL